MTEREELTIYTLKEYAEENHLPSSQLVTELLLSLAIPYRTALRERYLYHGYSFVLIPRSKLERFVGHTVTQREAQELTLSGYSTIPKHLQDGFDDGKKAIAITMELLEDSITKSKAKNELS